VFLIKNKKLLFLGVILITLELLSINCNAAEQEYGSVDSFLSAKAENVVMKPTLIQNKLTKVSISEGGQVIRSDGTRADKYSYMPENTELYSDITFTLQYIFTFTLKKVVSGLSFDITYLESYGRKIGLSLYSEDQEMTCYIETSLLDLNSDGADEHFYIGNWDSITINQNSDVLSTNGFTSGYSDSFLLDYASEISIALDLTFSLNLIHFIQNDLLFLEETAQPTLFNSASGETTESVLNLTNKSSNVGLYTIIGIGLVFVIILVMGRKR